MATSNSLSTETFKVPPEPCPLPSLGSDEESFVVLWKDRDSNSIIEVNHEPIGVDVVEEAKKLISKELNEIEQMSLSNKQQSTVTVDALNCETNKKETYTEKAEVNGTSCETQKQVIENAEVEQATVLPMMPEVEKGFETNDVISIATLSTDLTSVQLQNKVSEIVEENIRLKDTILQNNMSMKSQYERIVAWQEDVKKVHQAHKDKIIEAKEFIDRLKKDNYNLIRELEISRASNKTLEEEIASLKRAINDKEQSQQEIAALKRALSEKQQYQQEAIVRTSDDNMKQFELDVANNKIKELELAVKNLKVENANLKSGYVQQIDRLQKELDARNKEAEEHKMEIAQIKAADEEKLNSLNETVEQLRSQLHYTSKQQNMLPSAEEVNKMKQQLASTQVVLTQVEHARTVALLKVDRMNQEIGELKAKLQGSQSQVDEVYALKAQLDVYKADFEAEKNAKEIMKTEKEVLAQDMQNLQRRNQQLQEEIDLLIEKEYVVPPAIRRDCRSTTTPSAPPASSSASATEHPYKCPVCNFGFKNQQTLETHVYRCIELDDHLP